MVPKWETLTLSQQCGPGTKTKTVHIQGRHNKNNISKNKERVQKMLMWRCFVRASLRNTSGPVHFIPNFEHCTVIRFIYTVNCLFSMYELEEFI